MGILYLVSTPIGNLEDITLRAIKLLLTIPVVACEDSRKTGLLVSELRKIYGNIFPSITEKPTRFIVYNNITEMKQLPELLSLLENGVSVGIVSDAGTPLISDPGFLVVREAIKRGIKVVPIPGSSSVLAALSASGFSADSFLFLGYPPEKQSHRLQTFTIVKHNNSELPTTNIFFCAPHKLRQTLSDMHTVYGDIPIVLGRELTKVHEEFWRGTVQTALQYFTVPKGEFILLFRL